MRSKMPSDFEPASPEPSRSLETRPAVCSCCGSNAASIIASGRDYIYHGSHEYLSHVACDGCGHIYLNPQPTPNALPVIVLTHRGVDVPWHPDEKAHVEPFALS